MKTKNRHLIAVGIITAFIFLGNCISYASCTGDTARFSSNAPKCISDSVKFIDASTIATGDAIVSWKWNFGDLGSGVNNTSTLKNPSHLYSAGNQTFFVKLVATYSLGCKDSITIGLGIQGAVIVNAGSDITSCKNNLNVNLVGSIANAGGGIWSGSGTFSNPNSLTAIYTPTSAAKANGNDTLVLKSFSSPYCPNVSDTVVIHFNAGPIVNAGQDIFVCSGFSIVPVSATVTGASGGLWHTSGTGSFTNANNTSTTYHPSASDTIAGSVILYIESTGNGICSPSRDSILVTFIHSLTINANASSNTICSGGSVTLSGSGANSYTWSGGVTDGMAFVPSSTMTYTVTGTTATCSGTATKTITVTPISVTANASVNTAVCEGAMVTLTGSGATSYSWTGGVINGVAFSAPSSTTTYTVTGTTAGCFGTATKTISVYPKPTATFTVQNESSSLYCDGSIVAYLTGGTGTIQAQWLNSSQTVLSSTDSIGSLCPDTYTLHLTDANGCTNTYAETIQTGPIPPTPQICMVTVDNSNTHNLVIWEKTNLDMTAIDSIVVYREIGTNSYQYIGSVSHDSLSTFDDFGSNPTSTGYRYKLKSKNFHSVESSFSDYHNTIYLTNTGANFSWTQYQIENNTTPVFSYHIFRDDNSTGNFHDIGNTTGNQFGYTDVNYSSYPNSQYYVEAVMTAGSCNPTRSSYAGSRSNLKHIGLSGIQQLSNVTSINTYPNPANNTLNITGIKGKTILRLYDVAGRVVLEKVVENDNAINISQIEASIYTLVTISKYGDTFTKVVISH